jgi:hypothetical protein
VQSELSIVSLPALPSASLNRIYARPLEIEGGNWPYRWSLAGGQLPPGLELDESGGTVRGTPTLAGTYEFDVQVRDAFRATATQRFRLEVGTLLEIHTAHDLPDAVGPGVYSQQLAAAGGDPPLQWSVAGGSFPRDFSLDATTGVLSGVPTTKGDHRFTVEVSDGSGTKASRLFRLRVIPALRFSQAAALPHGIAGEPYSLAIEVVGGKLPYSWAAESGTMPEGLSLNQATGVIEGAPQTPGRYRFRVQVTDSGQESIQQFFEMTVQSPAPGEMVWRGQLAKDQVLTISDGRYASTGTITGNLPGVPIKIDIEPKEGVTVVTAPARSNDWKVLVIYAAEPQTQIVIRWTPLSSL